MHLIGDPEGASKLVKLEQEQDVIRKVVLALYLADSLIYHCYCLVLYVKWVACENVPEHFLRSLSLSLFLSIHYFFTVV